MAAVGPEFLSRFGHSLPEEKFWFMTQEPTLEHSGRHPKLPSWILNGSTLSTGWGFSSQGLPRHERSPQVNLSCESGTFRNVGCCPDKLCLSLSGSLPPPLPPHRRILRGQLWQVRAAPVCLPKTPGPTEHWPQGEGARGALCVGRPLQSS